MATFIDEWRRKFPSCMVVKRLIGWVRWPFSPGTGFEIGAMAVWGRARDLSVTKASHKTEEFCVFEIIIPDSHTPACQARGVTTTPKFEATISSTFVTYYRSCGDVRMIGQMADRERAPIQSLLLITGTADNTAPLAARGAKITQYKYW